MTRRTKFIFIIIGAITLLTALILIICDRDGAGQSDDSKPEKLRIDTIMYANGHSFGYSGDITMWNGWYFDTIPVGDDYMLKYESAEPSSINLSLITRDITVNFEDSGACEKIKNFLSPIDGFKRFKKKYEICIDSVIDEYGESKCKGYFSFIADYADSSTANADKINSFVYNLAGVSELSDSFLYKTVEEWKMVDDLPYISSVGTDLAIRAHISNPKFVTFGIYSYSREGSGHGMYTETFQSFDIGSGNELDNSNLFKPHTSENVKSLLFEVMANDTRYVNSYEYVKSAADVKSLIDSDSELILPEGALTDSGIVFSFQPYEIDCWAAGAYHFIVPYNKLMPFLTAKAKGLVKGCHL